MPDEVDLEAVVVEPPRLEGEAIDEARIVEVSAPISSRNTRSLREDSVAAAISARVRDADSLEMVTVP
jgi:hypothetical protein